jgi:SpoVK/Ycf46/Vps4 family AAA+-type ATPase
VPLLKLDAGRLYGGLVGQSEANLRSVIQTAEAIAPCCLWLDELEKGLAGSKSSGATDGGTSARVLGSLVVLDAGEDGPGVRGGHGE